MLPWPQTQLMQTAEEAESTALSKHFLPQSKILARKNLHNPSEAAQQSQPAFDSLTISESHKPVESLFQPGPRDAAKDAVQLQIHPAPPTPILDTKDHQELEG